MCSHIHRMEVNAPISNSLEVCKFDRLMGTTRSGLYRT